MQKSKLTNSDLQITFTDENTEDIEGNKHFARGGTTAIYKVNIKSKNPKFRNYEKETLILRLLEKNETEIENYLKVFIEKYQNDLLISEKTKKYFIDILFFGSIKKNNKSFAYFIVPNYDTEGLLLNKLSSLEKRLSLENTIKMLKLFNNKNKFIDDLKITNISIDKNLEPVLIDYDINTIINLNEDTTFVTEYLYNYYNDPINKFKLDKIYSVLLVQMIYQFYYLGKYEPHLSIKESFTSIFAKKKKIKGFDIKFINVPSEGTLNNLDNKSIFIGQSSILFNFENKKGLLAEEYDNILSLDEVLFKIKFIMDKPTENTFFSKNSQTKLSKYVNNNKYKISNYGIEIKDFENPNLYKFDLQTKENYIANFDKLRLNHYYFRKHKWNIIEYENDKDSKINNETLRYALQSIGCIHTVRFNGLNNAPEFTLHLNKDFKKKYGYYFDNCRVLENQIWVLLFWIVEITNLFTMISSKYDLNKEIYLNIHDHPINKGLHPIGTDLSKHPYPNMNLHTDGIKIPITSTPTDDIFCWPPKKGWKDIGLPFHDIWMHLFSYWFAAGFNIDNYSTNIQVNKSLEEKEPQAFFRGSYTNCSYPIKDSVRLISHLRSLQDKEQTINSYVVGGPTSFQYQHFDQTKLLNSNEPLNYWIQKDKYYPAKDQPIYRYILNLDGFASAFRIIKELYYNSILIIPESEYTDIMRDILKPWVHYVPVKGDLSNLENTVKWCNENLDKMNIILENMKQIRDKVITIENMLFFTYEKIRNKNNRKNLTEIINYDNSQEGTIGEIPVIEDDVIKKLGKKTEFKWVGKDGTIERKEEIYYQKYLKYKNKYLQLRKKLDV